MKKYLLLLITSILTSVIFTQDLLFVKGNVADPTKPTLYIDGHSGTTPTLYVDGGVVNDNGVFVNDDGIIEVTKNWTNTVGTGASKYESTGVEKFSGTANQNIVGKWDGTGSTNQFYNMEFNNPTTVTLGALTNSTLNNHSTGSTKFTANTVVITGSNFYYVRNSDPAKLSGYGLSGVTNKFFQGKLKREAIAGESYELPVGYSSGNTAATGEGVQMATVSVVTGSGTIESTFTNGGASTVPIIICPGAPSANARDADIILDNGFWTISGSGITKFDMKLDPKDFTAISNLEDYTIIQDGAKTGKDDCTGNFTAIPITHAGLTSFSKWEVGASNDGAPLPVELISLDAYGVKNTFITIDWETATEISNEGFEIQRSEDGINFVKIGYIEGNGTSSNINAYTFNDLNVMKAVVYYYRLKQIDFDGHIEYTHKVNASLKGGTNEILVSSFIPNPTISNSHIEIQVSEESYATIVMFNGIGQLIYKEKILLNEGLNTLPFDLKNLATGIYHTTLNVGGQSYTRKLNITK